MKRTYPDHAKAKLVTSGSAAGSIVNYWPPRLPLSDKALRRIRECEAKLVEIRKRRKGKI